MLQSIQDALDSFEVTEGDVIRVLSETRRFGGDFGELFFQENRYASLELEDRKVKKALSSVERGVGIRVIHGDRTGYSFTEDLSVHSLLICAQAASRIALLQGGGEPSQARSLTGRSLPQHYPLPDENFYQEISKKVSYLKDLDELLRSSDDSVTHVTLRLAESHSHILVINSEGEAVADKQPLISLSSQATLQRGERRESGNASDSFRMGKEFYTPERRNDLAKRVLEQANFLFGAEQPKGGTFPVVFQSGGSGILLHEAIGHTFEADFNRKGVSVFSERLGDSVASDQVSVVDDGTLWQNRGSINIDDEGVEAQKTYLVKEGVLNSYLHDRISAKHYGVEPTGNGRRESYRHPPLPRMRSTYMESGRYEPSEIIASVNEGIYVKDFTNGQVNIGAGDFTFYVKTGYLIEGGVLTKPIKDINVIGNGPKALAAIEMVGNDLAVDNGTWMCGKSGQSVVVTCGMPTVKVGELTVGGLS